MSTVRHICQSVEGALKNWTMREWRAIAKENNCTVAQAKESFWQYLRDGKLVIPIGEPCKGFDYKFGCIGHIIDK